MIRHILIWALLTTLAGTCWAGSITAGSKAFPTIKSALGAAKDGDTVFVLPGIYRESPIEVKKSVFLIGRQRPVLDGVNKNEIMIITADGVLVEGFHFRNSGFSGYEDVAALRLMQCRHAMVRNNHFTNTFFGVYGQHAFGCTIRQNTFYSSALSETISGNGIHCWKSDSMIIKGNHIRGHRDGIYFEFVTNSVIWRNHSYKNMRYGLHFMFSDNDAYISNIFQNNGAGVSVMYTHKVKMFNNIFEENWGDAAYGIFLKEISDSHIAGNKFLHNTSGIFMEGTNRILVEKNVFTGNGWAMKIQASCVDNVVVNNNFKANSFDIGTNGSLVMNKFDHNYWDKYEGYDLNRDKTGDVPYRPVSLYSMIVEKNPAAMMLFRSFMTSLLDKSEKILPTLTPESLKDNFPRMKPLPL